MKENANISILGRQVVLVPYREEHVALYHSWMQDPFLQEMTASEPLSLEEEYEMQQNWASDAKKCTFIVLDKERMGDDAAPPYIRAMAGDVNLFLNDPDDDHVAEIEVMIAEPKSRGRGLAKEALRLLMIYALAPPLAIHTFRAKIGETNAASLRLFHSLGFEEVSRSRVFSQVTLELTATSNAMVEHAKSIKPLVIEGYEHVPA